MQAPTWCEIMAPMPIAIVTQCASVWAPHPYIMYPVAARRKHGASIYSRISGSLTPPFRRDRAITTWSLVTPMAYPMMLPTNAAKKTKPVEVVLKLYGASVRISEMVLNETMPAVAPNAYMNPA